MPPTIAQVQRALSCVCEALRPPHQYRNQLLRRLKASTASAGTPPPVATEQGFLGQWMADAVIATDACSASPSVTPNAPTRVVVAALEALLPPPAPALNGIHHRGEDDGAGGPVHAPPSLHLLEHTVMNVVADRLGLPPRFLWLDAPTASLSVVGGRGTLPRSKTGCASGVPSQPPAAARSFLWATAAQAVNGDQSVLECPTAAALTDSCSDPQRVFLPVLTRETAAVAGKGGSDSVHVDEVKGSGGGYAFQSAHSAYLTLLHTARTQALVRSAGRHFSGSSSQSHQDSVSRLTIYCSDQVDPALLHASQLLGFPRDNIRILQTVITPQTGNYSLDVNSLKAKLTDDLMHGYYPCLVVGVFGSALSAAVDDVRALGTYARKVGVWFHIDASHGMLPLLLAGHPLSEDNERAGQVSAPPPSLMGDDSAVAPTLPAKNAVALAHYFRSGAAWADSVLLGHRTPLGCLATAGAAQESDVALLYVSAVPKVRAAQKRLHNTRQCATNYWSRLSPVDEAPLSDVRTLQRLAIACAYGPLMYTPTPTSMHAHLVLQLLSEKMLTSGLWDGQLKYTHLFGVMYARLLTQADEVTAAVANEWQDRLSRTGDDASGEPQAVIGLVTLQKRQWMVIGVQASEVIGDPSRLALPADVAARFFEALGQACRVVGPMGTPSSDGGYGGRGWLPA